VSAGASNKHIRSEHKIETKSALPEYFIKVLTDPGDLVIDPFGGSCVTGEVSEALRRKWICCELNAEYLEGAKARFGEGHIRRRPPSTSYKINSPCSLEISEKDTPLVADGGRKRPAQVHSPLEPRNHREPEDAPYAATLFE
jgi:DNA methylase